MMLKLWVLLIVLPIAVVGFVMWPQGIRKPKEPQVLLHNHGTTVSLDTESPLVKSLLASCQEALTSSYVGRMLQEAVFPQTIEEVRNKDVSIEIIYPVIQMLQTGEAQGFVRIVKLDRLLIPLSGQFAESATKGKYVTVFYGVRSYDSGPYTNSEEFQDKIRGLLKNMGYAIQ